MKCSVVMKQSVTTFACLTRRGREHNGCALPAVKRQPETETGPNDGG